MSPRGRYSCRIRTAVWRARFAAAIDFLLLSWIGGSFIGLADLTGIGMKFPIVDVLFLLEALTGDVKRYPVVINVGNRKFPLRTPK
jgi:hypothetical protein